MTYKTKGVCSREINFEVEDNKVKNVQFVGRVEGIRCGFKATSCPDQLAQALKEYKVNMK